MNRPPAGGRLTCLVYSNFLVGRSRPIVPILFLISLSSLLPFLSTPFLPGLRPHLSGLSLPAREGTQFILSTAGRKERPVNEP